jgi:hypothetical protein
LKNHNKSQKNRKMENPIALYLEWVNLHSEHIIWYAVVHIFTPMKKSIDIKLQQKIYKKRSVLYVHYVDLPILSPKQLDFSFYDFSVIYCDFSKLL